MNGHFAAVGNGPSASNYEHGIQIIDEEKSFKFVTTSHLALCCPHSPELVSLTCFICAALTSTSTLPRQMWPKPASITT